MKTLCILAMAFLSIQTFAQDRGDALRQVRTVSNRIVDETYISEAPMRDIIEARALLVQALRLLKEQDGRPGDPDLYQECIDYAYKKYYRDLDSATSLDRAQKTCRNVYDMDVLKYLYTKHFRDNNSSTSIFKATQEAGRLVRGKLALIDWAYKKHFRDLPSSQSASKAVANAAEVNRRSGVACYEKYFKIYYRSLSSSQAMDKTAETCSNI